MAAAQGPDDVRGPLSRRAWLASVAIAVVVIGGFVAYLAISRVRQQNSAASQPGVTVSGGADNLTAGSPAPDFTAPAFDGSTVKLSSLRGKVVLVNFFASWCLECRAEMPAIQEQYLAKRAAGFEVVGVDAFDNIEAGKAFYQQMGATFPAVADPQTGNDPGVIARAFGINTPSLPISVFIDRDGKVHQVFPGGIDAANIRDQLRQMGISQAATATSSAS
ncbi:MAG: TlpA family protein disulfide reductase [Candidatus Dormibacteraeota bacterium]|nr:TlpA family protein disulfide reductase [Candidatus Dormibacteraeota bacterium]